MTEDSNGDTQRSGANGARKSLPPAAVARRAAAELAELLGRDPEGVIGLRRTDERWCVDVEVVEVRRIPDTADIIAEYEVDADRRGRLQSYQRIRRYPRGRAGDDR